MSGPHRKAWRQRMRYSVVEPLNIRGEASYAVAALGGGLVVALLAVALVVAMYLVAP